MFMLVHATVVITSHETDARRFQREIMPLHDSSVA